ncbi:MAG: aspartyl protease family protein [Thermonemataceae bacterium]
MRSIILSLLITFYPILDIAAQSSSPITTIPFKLEGNHLMITTHINQSKALNFVFDTGAGATVINVQTAAQLQLKEGKQKTSDGAAGKVSSKVIADATLQIGSVSLRKVDLESAPLTHLEKVFGKDIDGLLGYDLLKQYVVKINYDKSVIEIYNSKKYQYRGSGKLIKIDVGDVPTAKATISLDGKNTLEGEFILDNGAGSAMSFCTPYAEKHQLQSTIGKTYKIKSRGYSSNEATVSVGRLKRVEIQQFQFSEVPVSIYDTQSGVFSYKGIAGVIGNDLLKRFNITFDYKRKKTYWEPNDRFKDEPFYVDYSGLRLSLDETKTKVLINNIIPESPSSMSDLKIGDEIIEIDNIKAADTSLANLRKLLYQEGKKVEVKYKRGNTLLSTVIQLKALI